MAIAQIRRYGATKNFREPGAAGGPSVVARPRILIFGLGNPDPKYKNTYHNAGLSAVEQFGELGKQTLKKSPDKLFRYIKTDRLILAVPLVFMNESGKAAREAIKLFGLKSEDMVIVHDDSDLKLGDWKAVFGRGSAGHKGVQSIINTLGTKNFWRIRLGIRPSGAMPGKVKAEKFVLKNVSGCHQQLLETAFRAAAGILGLPH